MGKKTDNKVAIVKPEDLSASSMDYMASCAKGILGAIPFAGAAVAEITGYIVPNQRMDRLVRFVVSLNERLSAVEQALFETKKEEEYFVDLAEEILRQAAKSIADERRGCLASLLKNSLSSDEMECVENKHLLQLFSDINDAELIILRSYSERTFVDDKEFRELHKEIIDYPYRNIAAPQEAVDKATISRSYREHLTRLGLLENLYKVNSSSPKMMEIDKRTGKRIERGYQITKLGKLLLKRVSFEPIPQEQYPEGV
ncbi:MAG TPA: hypothetical protein PLA03_11865 [Acidobacteriota bacterium]|nr:hypothetical protein [Acidobacteriota bacterium]